MSQFDLSGQVAIVTGSSRGIGGASSFMTGQPIVRDGGATI